MSKIKVYDADALIRREADMSCHTFKKIAVFQGPHGVVVAEQEAVHDKLNTVDDSFRFSLTKIPSPGKMYVVPTAYAEIPVSFILKNAPCEEMEFYDFFSRRNYNPRCESNFRHLCAQLREIGIDIPKEPLSQKLKNADLKAAFTQSTNRAVPTPERC